MSIKLLRDQKEEYSEHLFEVMFEPVLHIFQDTYEKALQSNPKNVLKEFQQELSKIPEWNQLQVEKAYQNIKCDYFGKLIKTVYILTIKTIMMGIPEDKRDKLKLRVPASDNFLHRCLIHMARELWKRPYLFYHLARSIERQNNIYNCEVILKKKIKAVIRETIPMNWVVEQLGGKEDESQSESETEEEEKSETSEEEEETSESEAEPDEEETSESEAEEEVSESETEEEEDNESESETEEETSEDELEEVNEPSVMVEKEDIRPSEEEITVIESGYERSEETTTPSVSNEEAEEENVPVIVIETESVPVPVLTDNQVPVPVPLLTDKQVSVPVPLLAVTQLPEPQLQNLVIPRDESKRVVYLDESKPILKKKKPKHTFF